MKKQNYMILQNGPRDIVRVRMSNGTYFFRYVSKPTIIKRLGLLILRFAMLLDFKLFKDRKSYDSYRGF